MKRRTLYTSRLRLEAATPDHADGVWEAIEVSLPELRPWLGWTGDAGPGQTRQYLERSQLDWESGNQWNFVIFVNDETVAGSVGINNYLPLNHAASIGYWMRSDLAGKGIMTEAAGAGVEFAFDDLGLHRLELRAAPRNLGSRRVAEKLGFKREGVTRGSGRNADGEFHDHVVYGLLSTDPRPSVPAPSRGT